MTLPLGPEVGLLAEQLTFRMPYLLGQDVAELDVSYDLIHIEDVVDAGRILAFGIELYTLDLPATINHGGHPERSRFRAPHANQGRCQLGIGTAVQQC